MKNKTLQLCLISLGAYAVLVVALDRREETAAPNLQPLDQAVQAKFDVSKGFGIGQAHSIFHNRVRRTYVSPIEAMKASDDLRTQGWQVNFYLGGRELLNPSVDVMAETIAMPAPVGSKKPHFTVLQRALRGPISATGHIHNEPTSKLKVAKIARRALQAMMNDKSLTEYRTRVDRWRYVIYPVNATKNECISCHHDNESSPRVGDTLGVTVYAYRRAS